MNNDMIVSSGRPRNSAIHIRVSIPRQTPLPSRGPYNTEQRSLCFAVGSCCLSVLNIAVFTGRSHIPQPSLPPRNHKFVL